MAEGTAKEMGAEGKYMRIIVKIGTNSLMADGGLNTPIIRSLAKELSSLRSCGRDVILVTSGAIGSAVEKLGTGFPKDTATQAAMAAIGQSLLMHEYELAFAKHGQTIAQILLTHHNFTNEVSLSNLCSTVEKLFEMSAIPIINENDAVSREALSFEKPFSDNDGLAALLCTNFKADLLIILTDVDGVFTQNPKDFGGAKKISGLKNLLATEVLTAGRSKYGIGGMSSKINAAKKALEGGASVAICKAREGAVLDAAAKNCSGSFFEGGI